MLDHPGMKLGRLPSPPAKRARTLGLSDYLEAPAPEIVDLTAGITTWPMFLNQRFGCCTVSAAAHMLEIFGQEVDGEPRLLADEDVLALYNLVNGGVDGGANMLDVLSAWRKVGLAGDRIYAYVDVRVGDHRLIEAATWYFSGTYIGANLPLTAQVQTGQSPWSVVQGAAAGQAAPGSWGGHAINVVGYDPGGLTVVTWGALQRMTWEFWDAYVDETYCVIPSDYDRLLGKALANGFNLEQLQTDLAKFGEVNQ